ERRKVTFRVPAEILSFYDDQMQLIIEKGQYVVEVGSSSEDIRLRGDFEVSASARLLIRRAFSSSVSVE
ncbi:MAG: fibronectin type III-like domain-contianing protein, partial [TACK group archaeon]|nr:fibronectin type III-like domain-contianing protein [TACK group archaeon]